MGLGTSALILAAALLAPALAQGDGGEIMHAAVGFSFPTGPSSRRMELGWTLSAGSTLWLGDHFGLRGSLEYHNFGLTRSLLRSLGAASDGHGEVGALVVSALWRLHGSGEAGFYAALGGGGYQRSIYLTQEQRQTLTQDETWAGLAAGEFPPSRLSTSRGGASLGLGWETPLSRGATFFVELSYHRIFTPGQATEILPLVFGTRF